MPVHCGGKVGKLTPASGTTGTSRTTRDRADDWAMSGTETITVEVLDQSLKKLAEKESVIEVARWRTGSFAVLTQDVNCVVPDIVMAMIRGRIRRIQVGRARDRTSATNVAVR